MLIFKVHIILSWLLNWCFTCSIYYPEAIASHKWTVNISNTDVHFALDLVKQMKEANQVSCLKIAFTVHIQLSLQRSSKQRV